MTFTIGLKTPLVLRGTRRFKICTPRTSSTANGDIADRLGPLPQSLHGAAAKRNTPS
jgi:hypothetical protein